MEIEFDRDARFWLGIYEVELARPHPRLVRPASACFDLGSESGFYALVFARLGGGRVLAVEADKTTSDRLRRNVAANPDLAPAIAALTARVTGQTSEAAGTVSLDDSPIGEGGFVPDLVKIDVEGKRGGGASWR